MRLIDADELKKVIHSSSLSGNREWLLMDLDQIIDNAPTVETERPQGKWMITKDEKFYRYKCPFCGRCDTNYFLRTNGNLDLPNFCERCGADLRGNKK